MNHCKKRGLNDCGICALVVLAGVDYDFLRPLLNEGSTASIWFVMNGACFLTGKKYQRLSKSGIFEQLVPTIQSPTPILLLTRYEGYTHYVVIHENVVYDSELDGPQSVKDYERKNWEVLDVVGQRTTEKKPHRKKEKVKPIADNSFW
jgi:hypothetical protein